MRTRTTSVPPRAVAADDRRGGARRAACTPRTFININVPSGDSRSACASPSRRSATTSPWSTDALDPRGRPYYWIEEGQNDWEPHDRSDYQAVKDGYVSMTPLQPDLTDYGSLEQWGDLVG